MLLRPATAADVPAIVQVHMSAWDAAKEGWGVSTRPTPESRTARWTQIFEEATWSVVVACDPDVVGFIAYGLSRDPDREGEHEVYVMYVRPDHWRRGIGRALMAAVPDFGTPLSLWVAQDNLRARDFYASCGFTPDGATEMGHHVPAMRMAR